MWPREVKTLGDELRRRRLELGLLQREVADRLGVSAASVWQWERNRTEPQVRYLPAIYDFLGYVPLAPSLSLPEALRAHRRAAGLTQEGLSSLARIDESTLAKWERGEALPSRATLTRLVQFFSKIGQPLPDFGADAIYGPERRSKTARRASEQPNEEQIEPRRKNDETGHLGESD